jgi:hypothetical protein
MMGIDGDPPRLCYSRVTFAGIIANCVIGLKPFLALGVTKIRKFPVNCRLAEQTSPLSQGNSLLRRGRAASLRAA